MTPSFPTSTRSTIAGGLASPVVDEKKLFDVIARAYLSALMPDSATGRQPQRRRARLRIPAAGRQPIDLGWRAAFPEWHRRRKGRRGTIAAAAAKRRDRAFADPKIEDKETRPPPHYNEGTLIEAMQKPGVLSTMKLCGASEGSQGHWHAGDPGEIISGLKKQGFSYCPGKEYCVNRDRLSLFGYFSSKLIRHWSIRV